MKEDMTQEVLKRLDAFAAQLHTTGAQLWDILVAQARVEAIKDLLDLGVAGFVGTAGLYICIKLAIFCTNEDDKKYSEKNEGNIVAAFMGSLLTGVVGLIGAGCFLVNLTSWITPLLNPQYWALQQILDLFHK